MELDLQQTIRQSFTYSGIGLHTGKEVSLTCLPAAEDTGICFRRNDLPKKPIIQVSAANIISNNRCTTIGCVERNISIHTIEHLLAAVYIAGIDNLLIELNSAEPPVTDGSAIVFLDLFKQVGTKKQSKLRKCIKIVEPIYVKDKDATLIALPDEGFRISYTLSYDDSVIGKQFVDFQITESLLEKEIAPARTFGFAHEAELMYSQGLALGASEDNTVIVTDVGTVNPLRYPDEFVRHKVLDLVGDLSVNGRVSGHFIGIKSGHRLNAQLSRKIISQREAMIKC